MSIRHAENATIFIIPLKNKDLSQTHTFLTQGFPGFMKYLEHTRKCAHSSVHLRKLCAENAANGTFPLRTVKVTTARHRFVGQCRITDAGTVIPGHVF